MSDIIDVGKESFDILLAYAECGKFDSLCPINAEVVDTLYTVARDMGVTVEDLMRSVWKCGCAQAPPPPTPVPPPEPKPEPKPEPQPKPVACKLPLPNRVEA